MIQDNGADALIHTLVENGVDACFANPGTSEMQFVAALDREPRMRSVLCLFEGVATGAVDGFARMADRPGCTLLHLGPGYGNGLANLHNARRAFSPIVNVVGDHATYHRQLDAPLTSDIAGIVAPNSLWVRSADRADAVAALTAEAITAATSAPGGPVSLILPADAAWTTTERRVAHAREVARTPPPATLVDGIAAALRSAHRPMLLLGSGACRADGLAQASRIAGTGVRVFCDTFVARQARGAGRFHPERLPYLGEAALVELAGVDLMILVGTDVPVAFFAYPGKPSILVPEGCRTATLATRAEDVVAALALLADALDAGDGPTQPLVLADPPAGGALTTHTIGASIARHLPEGAVVCDDSVTSGAPIAKACATARPHDVLALTGGAIGIALPLAVGAGVACPERKIVALSGDGSAMYTIQALWTLARERIDATIVIFANRSYRILNIEMERTGSGNPGPAARRLLDIGDPAIDWLSMARAHGVPAIRCDDAQAFDQAFAGAMARPGPMLIEAVI